MSDIKRVVLTTLESQKVSEKVVKKYSKTARIRVPLPESNEDKCPEYNYKDELAAAKKKLKQNGNKEVNNVPNGLDPFGEENDDDVRRIALEMEAKYGTGMSAGGVKKRRKLRKDDYADIGAGYDESDSFIDNTDGYDEIVPPHVTTARGGFYINSGALEFKTDEEATSDVSSSSSGEDSENEKDGDSPNKSKRKRALDTTDEEDGNNSNHSSQQEQKKQNGDKPNISMQQAIKKKLFSIDKIQIKKRKLADQHKNTVKELLREKRTDATCSDLSKDLPKENKKPMRLSSVVAAIDSVIGRVEEPSQKVPEKVESAVAEQRIAEPNKNDDQRAPPPPPLDLEVAPSEAPKLEIIILPENLPAEILNLIENIKRLAREYKDGGKVKFFSGDVNAMLLSLERKCKVLGRSSRVRVYEHLAPFVRCRKETLIKRAKNLVFDDEQRKLKKTIGNLKNQIDQLMPALITNHEKECQRVLQRKFSQEAAANDELKNLKAPRRRFPLHEEMKRMIRDIVSLKKRCFLHEGKSKDLLEDLLTDYLKSDLLILWPEGWMSMTVLKKFCAALQLKTPDPKSISPDKHSQKPPTSSAIINYGTGNNFTITPVNLANKLAEVSGGPRPDSIIKSVIEKPPHETANKQMSVKPFDAMATATTEKVRKPLPNKSDHVAQDPNGVIVLSSKTKEDAAVIPKETTHCQIIDLTDTPVKSSKVVGDNSHVAYPAFSQSNSDLESTLKSKFPGLRVTAANAHQPHTDNRDDVQKVMESLKALQKLSSPSKSEVSNPAVSVIAFNKNYSNSNSSQSSSVNNDRTNFSGALGFQDEFQKQFISSFNHKSPPSAAPPSKPGYNKCS